MNHGPVQSGDASPARPPRRPWWAPSSWWARLMILLVLVLLIAGSLALYFTSRTLADLFGENRRLKEALANLTAETRIGCAKVISQERRNGVLVTRMRFAETDRRDPQLLLPSREFEVTGDVVHFDALVVVFDRRLVMDGKERALHLWRRAYGESTPPDQGVPLATPGVEPERYAEVFRKLPGRDRDRFWAEMWKLANDPDHLRARGVRAVYGNAVYRQVRPGFLYTFTLGSTGQIIVEAVPDL